MTIDAIGVTVVVPTLNRGEYLYDCLQDLLAQSHRPLEILVVDQSTDVPERVQGLVDDNADVISYHRVTFRGLPQARNHGWQHARHDAIVYVDDDVRCPPDLVAEHLRALQLPNVGVVAGGISDVNRPPEAPTVQTGHVDRWSFRIERGFSKSGKRDVDHVPGGNFSMWRIVPNEIGGFDEYLNVGAALFEETEFCFRVKRAGYRIFFSSSAHLDHLAGPSGGCRVDEVQPYIRALAHNRSIVIRRHLRWYQQLIAHAETLRLGLAFAVHYRQPRAFVSAVNGGLAGLKKPRHIDVAGYRSPKHPKCGVEG